MGVGTLVAVSTVTMQSVVSALFGLILCINFRCLTLLKLRLGSFLLYRVLYIRVHHNRLLSHFSRPLVVHILRLLRALRLVAVELGDRSTILIAVLLMDKFLS